MGFFGLNILEKANLLAPTIHYLSSNLDGGPIIERVVPASVNPNGFIFGMEAVLAGQKVIERLVVKQNQGTIATTQDP